MVSFVTFFIYLLLITSNTFLKSSEIEFRGTVAGFKKHFCNADFAKNVDIAANFEDYLFELAFENGNLAVARWFVQMGGDINKFYKDKISGNWWPRKGLVPLIAAVDNGHLAIVKLLLAMGANPNGMKCINAMECGHPKGPGNGFICKNWQALPLALYTRNNRIAKTLIKAGAERNYYAETKSAVNGGNTEIITALGMKIDSWDLIRSAVLRGDLQLLKAVFNNRTEHLKRYLPSESYDGFNYATLVNDSIEKENYQITYFLLDAQPNFNINSVSWSFADCRTRPIIRAIQKNKQELVHELIKRGAWLNPILPETESTRFDYINFNPLYAAAEEDNIGMIEFLLQKGANPQHLVRVEKSAFSESEPVTNCIKRMLSWSKKPNIKRIIQILDEHGREQQSL